ncbi:MAG: YggS family pyridoxal phosphate-dependent enzyme [Propionibacteriaceae bacterium]|nr:YggS family pyridoxal phosphate-dependent enzyme [Propionibacteriaceae bacterium]
MAGGEVASRLATARARVEAACAAAGRPAGSVRVLLATKTQPAALIREAFELPDASGMLRGENRVQELVAKGPDLADLDVETHLIGPLQSNKVNAALRWVGCVESVDSVELGRRLASRLEPGRVLDVMVQVNVSGEATKSGVRPDEALALARGLASTEGLSLTGFMTIGANTPDEQVIRDGYAALRQIRDAAVSEGLADQLELSMGMTADLELAIAEGATIVRLGTAVFGPRPPA